MARPATAAVRLLTGEREPVRLATTGNIVLSGLRTIDGVLTEVGDRVLVTHQTDQSTNGIYTASEGVWYRAADARTSRTMQKGTTVYVQLGSGNGAKTYQFNTVDPVIGTTSLSITGDADPVLKSDIVDEDDMHSNSDQKVPTQQSVKAYVDNNILLAYGGAKAALAAKAVDMWNGVSTQIECFGDSTMLGVDSGLGGITPQPAPDKLQSVLRDYYFSSAVTVTNRAVSGSRSQQMLEGTDGSGSTFEAKMAVSTAEIVICNHCINDCQNIPPTTPDQYRKNLLAFVNACIKYGKIPILQTPNPMFAIAALGTPDKANRLKNYVQIMRDVALATDSPLIEVYDMINSWVRTGRYRVSDLVPDGCHPTVITYRAIGLQMATPFLHPHAGLAGPEQFISTIEGAVTIDPANAPLPAPATRTGFQLISDAIDHAKSLKVAVRVDVPGLDICIAYPIWAGGKNGVDVAWDQVSVGGINQLSTAAFGGDFVHDHEVCIARDVPVGLHLLTMASGGGTASLGLSYVRSRRTRTKKAFVGGAQSRDLWRDRALQTITHYGAGPDSAFIEDDLLISPHFAAGGLDITFNSNMAKDTQFILYGVTTVASGGAGPLTARMGVGVGLDASGFVNVYQLTGAATYATTALNAVDFSGVARQWRLILAAGTSNLQVFVSGANLGTVALTGPYLGGFMGARANGAGKTIIVTDLRDIEH